MAEVQVVSVSKTVVGRGPQAVGSAVLVIQDFEMEMRKCKPGQEILSKPFKVKENFFDIKVFPNGIREAGGGNVGVCIRNLSEKEVTVSEYTISDGEKTIVEEETVFKEKGNSMDHWGLGKWRSGAPMTPARPC